jgi:hypothetical protein
MGRHRVSPCKGGCGRTEADVALSWHGLCPDCGERRQIENRRQLVAHHGPHFDHWLHRIRASVGAPLDGQHRRA